MNLPSNPTGLPAIATVAPVCHASAEAGGPEQAPAHWAPLPDARWRTSSRSQTSNCVEVASLPSPAGDEVAMRDSKNRGGPVLVFERSCWQGFLAGVRAGRFDRGAAGESDRPATPRAGDA